jgi:molybdenum cofactor cytidylyltransferase
VEAALVEAGLRALAGPEPAIAVKPFAARRIGAISTTLPTLKPSVIDKTVATFGQRLQALGGNRVATDRRVPHDALPLAAMLREEAPAHDLIVVFGAAAITDRRDVIPAAIEAAGGEVVHLGMPVDPGNLLLIGRIGPCRIIGAPGCARSPAENGFDWVLQRLIAGVAVGRADIQAMGVGGLLMEIVSRPQPREGAGAAAVAAVVLAAGRSTRMGRNKLIERVAGEPVVRHAVKAAINAGLRPVRVVTGNDPDAIHTALEGLDVGFVHNPNFASGMAGSLKAGIAALPDGAQAAVVLLGDMPLVGDDTLAALVRAHAAQPEALAVVPTVDGQRANPVLIGRGLFAAVQGLSGDVGARKLIETLGEGVVEVEVGDAGALLDVDTQEALEAARRIRN